MKIENSDNNLAKSIKEISKDLENQKKSVVSSQSVSKSSASDGNGLNYTKILILSLVVVFVLGIIGIGVFLFYIDRYSDGDHIFISQPIAETNDFYYFTLENGMRVLLVDPGKENRNGGTTSVALTVGVGSEADPIDFVGFTHLLEHLLFTGSKKYSEDMYIEKVVNKYNGENNGCTKSFTTSYFYELHDEGTEELIDVLADAVINPNFTPDIVKKELNNINSEISMRMTFNKSLAYYKLIKKIGNKNSRIFSDGFANIDAEKTDFTKLRNDLMEFHHKYYSANLITMTVISSVEKEKLKTMIEKSFEDLKNTKVERPLVNERDNKEKPFTKDTLGKIYYLKSGIDIPNINLVFQVPSQQDILKFNALRFFSVLLNYYSKNSLLDKYLNKNLITSLEDDVVLDDYSDTIYTISVNMVRASQNRFSEILSEFYSFVEFLKKIKNIEEVYNSLAHFSKLDFVFNLDGEEMKFYNIYTSPFDRVLQFSEILQENEPKHVFTNNNILYKFDMQEWSKLLEQFTPENCIIIYQSKDFKVKEKQPEEKNTRKLGIDIDSKLEESQRKLDPQEMFDTYLDKAKSDIILTKNLDFDGNLPYEDIKFPDEFFYILKQKIKTEEIYEIYKKPEKEILTNYNILNDCETPEFLAISEDKSDLKAKPIDTSKLLDLILDFDDNNKEKMLQVKSFENYKDCLKNEFVMDNVDIFPVSVNTKNSININKFIYRKTFQPKTITIIEVNNNFLKNTFQSKNTIDHSNILKISLFCDYLKKHLKYYFIESFLSSNKFHCKLNNGRFLIQIESLNYLNQEFIELILKEIKNLEKPENYKEEFVDNIKESLSHSYSNFDHLTALQLTGYYLNTLLDRFFIDTSSPEKLKTVLDTIESIKIEDLANLATNLLRESNMDFLYIGQPTDDLEDLSLKIQNVFIKDDVVEPDSYQKDVSKMLKVPSNNTIVLRLQNPNTEDRNNVYLSYFYLGVLNKSEKLVINVIIKYLHNYIFDVLRNQKNLGYVASAYSKIYYHHNGIVILLQGEKFQPHLIEKEIETTIINFEKHMKEKKEEDFRKTAEKIIDEIQKLEGGLKDISEKIFYQWTDERINQDKTNYKYSLINFDPSLVMQKIKEIFYIKDNQKRIILELFNQPITDEILKYSLNEKDTISKSSYEVKTLDKYFENF
jgi:secreted Zn-dependent insulinase-like peptidase